MLSNGCDTSSPSQRLWHGHRGRGSSLGLPLGRSRSAPCRRHAIIASVVSPVPLAVRLTQFFSMLICKHGKPSEMAHPAGLAARSCAKKCAETWRVKSQEHSFEWGGNEEYPAAIESTPTRGGKGDPAPLAIAVGGVFGRSPSPGRGEK